LPFTEKDYDGMPVECKSIVFPKCR
jgi:hypothetical protein